MLTLNPEAINLATLRQLGRGHACARDQGLGLPMID